LNFDEGKKMKPQLRTISILLLIAIFVAGCQMPSTGGITPLPTSIVVTKTIQAIPTDTQPVVVPTNKPSQMPPTPTTAIIPTATSTPLPSATVTTTPTTTSASCSNQIKFVQDVTIPDNTEILPGQDFIKTWRLQNAGTCTWTNKYALIFVSGDQMNGNSPLPLTSSTAGGSTVDVSVTLKAPGSTGTYKGNWELRDANSAIFGSGTVSTEPFYVQIKVVEGVSELNLGAATWTDNLDTANNWYLLDTPNTKFTAGDGKLVMTSINPGGGEEWGLSDRPSMKDYYLQATFITGSACSGLDRYGLLARAPDPDKGYVFEFSCDGHYRLYTWDGKNYVAIQEWHTAAPIKTGPNQMNTMGIWMKGTTLRLYSNSYKLAEFTDSTFDHGQFGLVIGSINTRNFTVNVDQVAYWELK
jgi:hypothetical protein